MGDTNTTASAATGITTSATAGTAAGVAAGVAENIYPQIGQALLKARQESGLTQDQLAERSHVSRITITRIETARINPSFKTLEALAHGMGRTLSINFDLPDDAA